MSFFSMNGEELKGSQDEFGGGGFEALPDGTQAQALIKKVSLDEYNGSEFYNVEWKLMDGTYKNRVVFQKIRCFSEVESKRKRALSMLARLFSLCNVPRPDTKPEDIHLRELQDKILGIRIGLFVNEETRKEYNYIEMISSVDGFETKTPVRVAPQQSAVEQYSQTAGEFFGSKTKPAVKDDFDDEIPFN